MRKARYAPEWRIITHTSSTRATRAVLTVLAAVALTVAAVLAPIAQSQALAAVKLKDVNSKTPHYEDVLWMADEGITKGFPDGTFQPYGDVTRCDMAAFLYRFAGSPAYTPSAADKAYFSDVDSSTPHAKEVWWLAHEGISKGWDVGGRHEFRPYESIKRCDMAAFLMRLVYGKKADVAYAPTLADAARFSDVQSSTPHTLAVWWMAFRGITTGFPDGTFRPYDTIKRCDMAAFLHRLAKSGLMEAASSTSTESGSGTTTTDPAKKTCTACSGTGQVKTGTKTVTDQAAYDEWVVDKEEWTEEVFLGVRYSTGAFFEPGQENEEDEYACSLLENGVNYSCWNEYDYILHEEEGHPEHHDAVTHTEDVYGTCTTCGGTGEV